MNSPLSFFNLIESIYSELVQGQNPLTRQCMNLVLRRVIQTEDTHLRSISIQIISNAMMPKEVTKKMKKIGKSKSPSTKPWHRLPLNKLVNLKEMVKEVKKEYLKR